VWQSQVLKLCEQSYGNAGVDLVRIDGSFPSFSDDDEYILYNEGFTGVSAVARDGSQKQLIFKVSTCCTAPWLCITSFKCGLSSL